MKHMTYVNPTDRIAAACIAAVRPWRTKFESDPIPIADQANQTARLANLVVRLVHQAAFQGIAPADVDSDNGTAALAAIADAIFSGKKKAAHFAALPPAWKHIVGAAQRIVDREEGAKRKR